MGFFGFIEHVVFTVFVVIVIKAYITRGTTGLLNLVIVIVKALPGGAALLQSLASGEARTFVKQIAQKKSNGKPPRVLLPKTGIPSEELLAEMKTIKEGEINPEDGKLFAYVYTADGDTFATQRKAYDLFCEKTGASPEHDALVRQFHHAFMHENALNPMAFPCLRRFENEIVSMSACMLNGDDEVVGSLTSGGTESILMAMKTYRDRARRLFPHIKAPEMVAPITIHPAHEKAACYFGLKIVHVPIGKDFKPDVREYEQAITDNTIALLTSAPQYCHGVVDPIEEISEIALKRGLPLHVDACFGGFMLPWVEKLGYKVPKFDFRVPGVTSITADIHKYGYGAKGASVVLYRHSDVRKYQIYAYSKWPGGIFGSPSMAGTRPGGNIAAAWVALRAMGEDGYLKMARQVMDCTEKLKTGISKIPGLCILGNPCMTSFAIASDDPEVNILVVADILESKGWKPERQQFPNSMHVTVMPFHTKVADQLIQELSEAAKEAKGNKDLTKKGTAGAYGMMTSIDDPAIVDDVIVEFFSEVYKL